MEFVELEKLARCIRRLAGLEDDELLLAPEIAGRLLGPRGVVFGPPGTCAHLDGMRIVVPRDHPDLNFAVAHELAELALVRTNRFDGRHVDRERAANYLGAAILAPPQAVRRAHEYHGERLRTIARIFALSQTSMALRIAEVRGDERAVVTRTGHVIVRSKGAFPWMTVPVLSVARGTTRWKGLVKAHLRGGIDEGRVALRANAIA